MTSGRGFWLGLVGMGLFWLTWLNPADAVEPNFGYYDETPPIDQLELDAVGERIQETQKRLKRPQALDVQTGEPSRSEPLPPPVMDERDGAPAISQHELDDLQKAVEQIQTQQRREKAEPSEKPPSSPQKGDQRDLEEELRSLSQRLEALERVLVGTEESPGLAGLIGGWTRQNGFFLMSANGNFFLRLPVLLQSDFRSFPGGQNGTNPGVRSSTFILQRVRPMVHFRLWRYFRGFMTPDLGNGFSNDPLVQGKVQTPDAFGEWDYFSAFRIRVGKFKSPIGLEMLQATQNLSFMERSLTRNLLPNRDLGAMVWGYVEHGLFEYQLGVFNGAPNANFFQEGKAFSTGKTMEARVFSRPFLSSPIQWLRGFGIGAGMSVGSVRGETSGQNPMQTETFSYTFFQYLPEVIGDGDRTRVSPQLAWYGGRLGLLAQYVRSTQHLRRSDGGPSARVSHDAWSAQISWLLTEDTASFGHIEPRRPLDPSRGQWGAWELAVRFAQLNLDPDTFTLNLADPGTSALRAKSTTLGLNWYLNSNVRITGNYVHTDFTGATPAYRAASKEDALLFRTQLTF